MANSDLNETHSGPQLRKTLGLFALIAFGVGDILGAGVYALVGTVSGMVGPGAWLSYLIAAIVAALTGLTYAELSSRFPKAGGAAHYTQESFRKPLLTFLIIFFVGLSGLFSFATSAHTFTKYATAFFPGLYEPIVKYAIPLMFILIVAYITARGINFSSFSNIICTVIEVSALVFIIIIGIPFLGKINYLEFAPVPDNQLFGTTGLVFSGAALAFFAFIGFEDMANLSEEAKNPERDIPVAICAAIVITSVIYCSIVLVTVSVLGMDELRANNATPLIDVVKRAAPWFPVQAYGIIPAFAVFNTGLLNLLMASRLVYGMSRRPNNQLPSVFSYIHPQWHTPVKGLIFATAIVVVMVTATDNVATLAGTCTTFLLIVFAILHGALLKQKLNKTSARPKFQIPSFIPVLGVVCCLSLLVSRPVEHYKVAFYLLAIALVLFIINRFILGKTDVEAVD